MTNEVTIAYDEIAGKDYLTIMLILKSRGIPTKGEPCPELDFSFYNYTRRHDEARRETIYGWQPRK